MFRPFKRGGLRTWILSLLNLSPKNGAEIMDQIETASQGWWRPSPGSVYPLLEELVKEGIIRKREDGRYELFEKEMLGTYLPPWGDYSRMPRTAEEILGEMEINISYLEDKLRTDETKINVFSERLQKIRDRVDNLMQHK